MGHLGGEISHDKLREYPHRFMVQSGGGILIIYCIFEPE
jgi:hypothetical protein